MPLTIPDDVLTAAHLTERTAQIEIACRFFQSGRLTLWQAAQWVGMSRSEFETELIER
jgi:predicted HTH domain antitoxin